LHPPLRPYCSHFRYRRVVSAKTRVITLLKPHFGVRGTLTG
jgi:hypothetical protein